MHIFPVLISAMFFSLAPMVQDDSPVGSYASKFEAVADNCKGEGLTLSESTVVVEENGKLLNVKITNLPTLVGKTGRKGKLRAEVRSSTKTPGLSARYGLNARVTGSEMQGVFVAEYFRDEKPLCTQSFSVKGQRKIRGLR